MSDHSQAGRAFRVDSAVLDEDVLLLEGFSGQERISAPYHYTLQLLSTNDEIDPLELLRTSVTVSLRRADGENRHFTGLINRFVQLGKSEDLTTYEAEVVPWLWFLHLNQDCRVFQHMSVIEIVEEIFAKYPEADYENKCVESYDPREYCVQYRESDLNFVSRVLEDEGIFYFFEHTEGGHKLTLVDDMSMLEAAEGQSTYRVATSPHSRVEEDVITEIRREHVVNPDLVTLRNYDYLQPSNSLEAAQGTGESGEIYDYPGDYIVQSDGERYATLILQEQTADRETIRGQSTCRSLTTGYTFELSDYYIQGANQRYLVVGAWHIGSGGGYRAGSGSDATYSNQFECTPVTVPYRPPRLTRRPVVRGSQTAVVVGPSGAEIHTDPDGQGRVKIQFFWDRLGERNENSSCWVRVSQPWAGKGWGGLAIPRIGQEVVVDFLEGDPDRPIIVGRVYNQEQAPPFSPGDGGVVSGMMSQTHQGSGFNEISMNDTAGEEGINLHGQKDMTTTILNDRTENVGNNETIRIGADRKETVGSNESITIGNNRSEKVGANEDVSIGSSQTHSVALNRTRTVGMNEAIAIGAAQEVVVGGLRMLAVGVNQSIRVGANQDESIGGNLSTDVGNDASMSVGDSRATSIGADDGLSVGKKLVIDAGDEIMLKTGKATLHMKKDGSISIEGKDILLKASGKLTAKASKDIVLKGKKISQN